MNYWETALHLEKKGLSFATVTLLSTRGHAPQDPGAKALITQSGLELGTVGGGKVEARAIAYAQDKLSRGVYAPEIVVWNLQRDIGMTCGGEVTFLFETHAKAVWKVVVFGAGHVAQALIRTLAPLDCQITCIDPRADWLEKLPVLPQLKVLCVPNPSELIRELDSKSYFVVMTQGHATDLPILEAIFRTFPQVTYLGAIGSEVKAITLKRELLSRGVLPKQIEPLRMPIGLPLGSNHPGEIAISIVAELLQVRDRLKAAE